MSLSNTSETALLNLIFNNSAWANVGDASGLQPSATAGNLYVALHSSDPGESGNQTTNEVAYTSYARVAVARSSGGWTISGASVSNTAAINFPAATGGSATATHFSVGLASSSTGAILVSGALASSLAISSGITPSFAVSALSATAD